MTGEKHGKLNWRSNNNAIHHAHKKRTMIARRENLGGTAPGRFLRQVQWSKTTEDHANVMSQAKHTKYATSIQKLYLRSFSDEEKTSHSHREGTS